MGIGGWELHDEEFEWFYGGWAGRTPSDAASFFEGYPGLWWIAGGYAIEALTGPLRQHDDCDPAVLGGEFELLRQHARGRMQLWSCSSGMMRSSCCTKRFACDRRIRPTSMRACRCSRNPADAGLQTPWCRLSAPSTGGCRC